jgi:hypothetical protein
MHFLQISQIRGCRLTSLIGSLPELGVPILHAFIRNIPNQKMPVDQPDRQLAGSRIAVLNAFITNIPNQKMPVAEHSCSLIVS